MKPIVFFLALVFYSAGAVADPCAAVQDISCGTIYSFVSNGAGDPLYPNGMNGQGCSPSTSQGGQESIYRFISPVAGTCQVNVNSASVNGNYVGYYYKVNAGGCSTAGWICIARNNSSSASLAGINLSVGDTLLLLLNAESTSFTSQSFSIGCAVNVCDNISNITCGDTAHFTANGFGNPLFPNGMNGQGCSPSSSQGGQESIYRFVVPADGTYQVNNVGASVNGNYVGYYYKINDNSCSNSNWTCFSRNSTAAAALAAFNWNAGDTILMLLNAEAVGASSQSFTISCAVNFCDSVTNVRLSDTVQFTAKGFGNPLFPNGMNGQGCSPSSFQGGQEKLYRFIAPATAAYQVRSVSAAVNANNIGYYYRVNSDACTNSGWTCLARNGVGAVLLGTIALNRGDTLSLLLNAEATTQSGQSFRLVCLNYSWAGVVSADWNTAANWSPAFVPDAESNVIIPAATPFTLVLQPGEQVACRSIQLLPGATTELLPGAAVLITH